VRLVDRSTHHLTLTRTGAAYRDRVAAAVAALDTVLEPVVVITVSGTTGTALWPPVEP
jgi:DNA-binding transcriptional LysR family regulator